MIKTTIKRSCAAALTAVTLLGAIPAASAASYITTAISRGTTAITKAANTTTGNGSYYTSANASSQEQQMLRWINAERAAYGLSPYQLDSSVSTVARAKSQDMIKNRYFAHQSPTLGSARDMLRKAGISFASASENIARYGSLSKAHVGLMTSAGHRNSILSRTSTHVGIGIVQDSSGNYYITQIFIRK